MDKRRVELQLRLLSAFLRAEREKGFTETLPAFVERSDAILDRVAVAVDPKADPELVALLEQVRAEVKDLRPKA